MRYREKVRERWREIKRGRLIETQREGEVDIERREFRKRDNG